MTWDVSPHVRPTTYNQACCAISFLYLANANRARLPRVPELLSY